MEGENPIFLMSQMRERPASIIINDIFELDTALMITGKYIFFSTYRKVVSRRPVYYSILDSLGQKSQYISIKFPLHKQSENPKMCY